MRARPLLQLLVAAGVVTGLWQLTTLLTRGVEQRRLPPGWTIVRPPSEVCTMALVGETLWTGGRDGLLLVDRGTLRRVPPPEGAPALPRVWAILEGRDGRVWVGHDGGLELWEEGRWHTVELPGLRRVLALAEDPEGRIMAGGGAGVAVGPEPGWRLLPIPQEVALPSYDVIFADQDGTLWLGSSHPTRGGLVSFDGSAWSRYAVGRELPHPSVNTVIRDGRGDLWIGTGFAGRGGAARLSRGQWTSFLEKDGLAGPKVRSIHEDSRGRLWFGSEYHGMAILEPDGTWHRLPPGRGLAGREVKVMLEDDQGYWFGTDRGLSHFRKGGAPPWVP